MMKDVRIDKIHEMKVSKTVSLSIKCINAIKSTTGERGFSSFIEEACWEKLNNTGKSLDEMTKEQTMKQEELKEIDKKIELRRQELLQMEKANTTQFQEISKHQKTSQCPKCGKTADAKTVINEMIKYECSEGHIHANKIIR